MRGMLLFERFQFHADNFPFSGYHARDFCILATLETFSGYSLTDFLHCVYPFRGFKVPWLNLEIFFHSLSSLRDFRGGFHICTLNTIPPNHIGLDQLHFYCGFFVVNYFLFIWKKKIKLRKRKL